MQAQIQALLAEGTVVGRTAKEGAASIEVARP